MEEVLLDRDDPRVAHMAPDEEILRAFEKVSAHADIAVVDEGATPTRCLKGGALRFDDDGCSVSRTTVLELANVQPHVLLTPPRYVWIASSTKQAIDEHEQLDENGDSRRPFVVVPDPFPTGHDEPKDAAHALIRTQFDYPSKTKRRLSIDTLAKAVFTAPYKLEA